MKRAKVNSPRSEQTGKQKQTGKGGPPRIDQMLSQMKLLAEPESTPQSLTFEGPSPVGTAGSREGGFDVALRLLAAFAPATLAAIGASGASGGAHDDGIVRTVGVGFTGALRALDLLIAAPLL